ncbi:MAG: hypothetical protein RIA62_05285 [Cyclobacteriaceae bacterium]
MLTSIYKKLVWYIKGKHRRPYTFNNGQSRTRYGENIILDTPEGGKAIYDVLITGKPLMISRFGSTELSYIFHYLNHRKEPEKWTQYHRTEITHQSGFYPTDDKSLDAFCKLYLSILKDIDVLGVWFKPGEDYLVKKYMKRPQLIPLVAIEPYYNSPPWSRYLKSKKVLVIHPFAESIEAQYLKNRKYLFPNENVLPDFQLMTIKAVQSLNGASADYASWFEALDHMKEQISQMEFDIAIIGAGAYGMPLASFIKGLGKQAIHMGGATQILFGIRGTRWDNHPFFQQFFNKHWIRPSSMDRPSGKLLEDEAYW